MRDGQDSDIQGDATASNASTKGKRKAGPGQVKGKGKTSRAAAIYHNCIAIAKWMKQKTRQPEVESPVTKAQRATAVSTIGRAWQEAIRRRHAPGVGKRSCAGRVAQVAAAAHTKVKRNTKFVRNARKLFIGVNIRVALEREQPIGSSWRNEWDFG